MLFILDFEIVLKSSSLLGVNLDSKFGKHLKWATSLVPFNATFYENKKDMMLRRSMHSVNYPWACE